MCFSTVDRDSYDAIEQWMAKVCANCQVSPAPKFAVNFQGKVSRLFNKVLHDRGLHFSLKSILFSYLNISNETGV